MRNIPPTLLALCLGLPMALLLPASTASAQTSDAPPPIQRVDPLIQKVVADISEERIADIMRKLETFGTRNTASDPTQTDRGVGAARQWILDQFKSYSFPNAAA